MNTEWANGRFAGLLPEGLTIIRHERLEDLEAALFEITPDEVREGTFGGSDEHGNEVELSWEDYRRAAAENGGMGYAIDDRPEIHLWFPASATREKRAAIIAHEIGHLVGAPLEDPVAEEARADLFAAVALMAMTESKRGAA